METESGLPWPAEDVTRVPYRLYTDANQYALEQERIFKGPVWHYLCLESEVANPGDFCTSTIGETPILVTRDESGAVNSMVNRCALLCMERRGSARQLTCVYHNWSYDLRGKLRAISSSASKT